MRLRSLLPALVLALAALTARAGITTDPFCIHRFDAFRATPVNAQSIVFIGNSITNMGAWSEFFGSDARIVNRGNSGCDSNEWLDELETVVMGRPAKVFLMIGTNDIGRATGTAQTVARNIRIMLERFRRESPATQVYVTSVFPSSIGARATGNAGVNVELKKLTADEGVEYIDLWDDLQGILDGSLSSDRLHVNAKGYSIWVNRLLPYLGPGFANHLPAGVTGLDLGAYACGLNGAYGMRMSLFSTLGLSADDVLFMGDEFLNAGEWAELLGNPRAKNRASAWGNAASQERTAAQWENAVAGIFQSPHAAQQSPAKVFLGVGRQALLSNVTAADYKQSISRLASRVLAATTGTKVVLAAQPPVRDAARNSLVRQYNAALAELAAGDDRLEFADAFSALARPDGSADDTMIDANDYLKAKGYNALARLFAPMAGEGFEAMSEEAFDAHYTLLAARQEAGRVIVAARTLNQGTATGTYTYDPEAVAALEGSVDRLYELLADPGITPEALTAETQAMQKYVDAVEASRRINPPSDGKIYEIFGRDRRAYMNSASNVRTGSATEAPADWAAAQWRLEQRADGDWNIVNLEYSAYLSPVGAAHNQMIPLSQSEPAAGWQFAEAATEGRYIITAAGGVQLNATHQAYDYKLFNWGYSSGSFNRTDAGCQFVVSETQPLITVPQATTAERAVRYGITAERGNLWLTEEAGGRLQGAGQGDTDAAQWELYARNDGTPAEYDIVNVGTGRYIAPTSTDAGANNQFVTTAEPPARGWTFTPCDQYPGAYILSSGQAQIHQANGGLGWRIINYGGGANQTDQGCRFRLRGREITTSVPVERLTLSPATLLLAPGKSATLTAVVTPENATDAEISWTSSDESVATVTTGGTVTAVAEGTATVTAACGGKTAACAVTVSTQTGIGQATAGPAGTPAAYDLKGRPSTAREAGIYIIGNRKILRKR